MIDYDFSEQEEVEYNLNRKVAKKNARAYTEYEREKEEKEHEFI